MDFGLMKVEKVYALLKLGHLSRNSGFRVFCEDSSFKEGGGVDHGLFVIHRRNRRLGAHNTGLVFADSQVS